MTKAESRPDTHDGSDMTETLAMLEARVERYLLRACQKNGLLCLKFVSPQRGGVPDRVIIAPSGTVFVEVKRPGEHLRRRQRVMTKKMRRYGARVFAVNTMSEVDDLVAKLLADDARVPEVA